MTTLRLCGIDDVTSGSSKRFDIGRHRIAVVRFGDEFHAVGDECTHADVSLSEGDVDADEGTIECWKHGSLFCVRTGEALTMPATRPVPVYTVEAIGEDVIIQLPDEEDDR